MQDQQEREYVVNGKHYIVQSKIGKGQQGIVYKAYAESTSELVALKVINLYEEDECAREQFKKEIEIYQKFGGISHKNIINYIDSQVQKNQLIVVLELFEGIELEEYLNNREQKRLGYLQTKKIFEQLLDVLIYLKKHNILHRDLKPANILYTPDRLKLIDFGVSKLLDNSNMLAQSIVGTPLFMAPEVIEAAQYDYSCDVYSLGALLYRCLYGEPPFVARNIAELLQKIRINEIKFNPTVEISNEIRKSLIEMLRYDPRQRIKIEDLENQFYDASREIKMLQETLANMDMKTTGFDASSQKEQSRYEKIKDLEGKQEKKKEFLQEYGQLEFLIDICRTARKLVEYSTNAERSLYIHDVLTIVKHFANKLMKRLKDLDNKNGKNVLIQQQILTYKVECLQFAEKASEKLPKFNLLDQFYSKLNELELIEFLKKIQSLNDFTNDSYDLNLLIKNTSDVLRKLVGKQEINQELENIFQLKRANLHSENLLTMILIVLSGYTTMKGQKAIQKYNITQEEGQLIQQLFQLAFSNINREASSKNALMTSYLETFQNDNLKQLGLDKIQKTIQTVIINQPFIEKQVQFIRRLSFLPTLSFFQEKLVQIISEWKKI